jgi:patatin-related protein
MNERELRIALVFYGGLSLAIYMHGISKEILKLTRASKVLQRARRSGANPRAGYDAFNDESVRETDSERQWFNLLQALGPDLNLRVVVDVISGTSAGGINGIMLARALAHDLPLDAHRNIWLRAADVSEMLASEARPTRWSKAYVRPLIWGLRRALGTLPDEILNKVDLLVRSRWWKPPFSGPGFYCTLLEAMQAMGPARHEHALLPLGHPLSLFVTLTDLHGRARELKLHNPVRVTERVHQMSLEFRYLEQAGSAYSDFDDECLPALAFAARATSSYAGLFPPMTLREALGNVAERGLTWPEVGSFAEQQLQLPPDDFLDWPFMDGGVLNNKPFDNAIQAIRSRRADREVVRRLLYIEPKPEAVDATTSELPSYLALMKRAVVDLPQAQPIGAEVERLAQINAQVRRSQQLVADARPRVNDLVRATLGDNDVRQMDANAVGAFRRQADGLALEQSGYVSETYLRLRWRVFSQALHDQGAPKPGAGLHAALLAWRDEASALSWVKERLETVDHTFRGRRLAFVLRRVNELYAKGYASRSHNAALSKFKAALYRELEACQALETMPEQHHSPELASLQTWLGHLDAGVKAADHDADHLMATLGECGLSAHAADEVLLAYLGFAFFDVLTRAQHGLGGFSELQEIKVMRLSPSDANAIREGGADAVLKSIQFGNLAGFFSREFRENDYLWGRLHACDRLVDLLVDAVSDQGVNIDVANIKRRLFESVLSTEAAHLGSMGHEIDKIRAELRQRFG